MVGCNVIDPALRVTGAGYSTDITHDALVFLHGLGFDAVEFSHAAHFSDRDVEVLRDVLGGMGLRAWSVHSWSGGDPLAESAPREFAVGPGRCAQVALGLGASVVVHHAFGPTPSDSARLAREGELLAEAWRPGIRWALENTSGPDQYAYALALADLLGPERAGICVDTGHAHIQGPSPEEVIRTAGCRLITTHLHDNHGQRDEHAPPGDGTIDFGRVAAALRETGYGGCVMLELTDGPPAERRPTIRDELARGARAASALAAAIGA